MSLANWVDDRLYTDIALGINAGITSICLLSGETRREELTTSEIKPDFVFESIAELVPIMNLSTFEKQWTKNKSPVGNPSTH